MRKFFVVLCVLFAGFHLGAQTTLSAGDVVFLGYNAIGSNAGAPNYLSMLVRKPIDAGTTIYLTNQNWNSTNSSFNTPISGGKQGTIKLVFDEAVSIGQIVEILFSTASTYLKSTAGTASYNAGSSFDFDPNSNYDEVYVYQYASGYTFLSGIAWSNTAPSSGLPPGIVYSGSSQNAFHNGTNGNNLKCGVWTPTSPSSTISFNAALSDSFYKLADWEFVSSNTLSNGYCPCNPDSVGTGITNLYAVVESQIVFDKYLYNGLGVWKQHNGTAWVPLVGGPDWSTNTRVKEVTVRKTLTLGSAGGSTVFESARLNIEDTVGNDGVEVIVESGNHMKIHYALSFEDGNAGSKPGIHLKSSVSGSQTYYATLAPTSALLDDADGVFTYDLVVTKPGWHHFQSPISSTFNDIAVPSGSFSFVAGAVGTGNFFSWDASTAQWTAATTAEDFSSKPYTILFGASEVPSTLRVSGPLSNPNQDAVTNLAATYFNPSSNGNVPGWTADGDDGWNFYGNPYLSPLATESLLGIFASNGNGQSNKMSGLDNKVYVWQPDNTVSNLTTDYRYRSFDGTTHAGDAGATYLPPFQAFFMRAPSVSSANGFTKSKKYRSTAALTSSNSIQNKTTSATDQFALTLEKITSGEHSSIYTAPSGKQRTVDLSCDILAGMYKETGLAFAYDSMLFAVKYWPIPQEDTSSIPVLVSHPIQGETFKLTSSDPNTFLLDKALNVLHSFQQGDYTFSHQTAYNASPRFTWIFAGNATVGLEEELWQPEQVVVSYGEGWVKFSYSEEVDYSIVDMQGKTLQSGHIQNGEYTLETVSMPTGLYTIMSNGFSSKFLVR
jgi:hypothetical protein